MEITLSGEHKVYQVPVLGASVHPGFVFVGLLKDSIRHTQTMFRTQIQ